jgi:D-alanyl-D-alanine dipeptidase
MHNVIIKKLISIFLLFLFFDIELYSQTIHNIIETTPYHVFKNNQVLPCDPKRETCFPKLIDINATMPQVHIQLQYTTPHNFVGRVLYTDLKRCFLVSQAAQQLATAAATLHSLYPHYALVLFDCARPLSVQHLMYEAVKDTPKKAYVGNPHTTGSLHNRGCAVDIGIIHKETKQLIDMGTPFDHLGVESDTRKEAELSRRGKLTPQHLANRALLRHVMTASGFYPLPHEWWHFDCAKPEDARRQFEVIDG